MRRSFALALGLVALNAAPQAFAASAEHGRALVQRNCGMCHAVGERGASANPASPPFRELGKRYAIDNLQEALAEGILTGHPAMPEFRFTPGEINDIVAYLKSIQERPQATGYSPKPAKAG